MTEDAPSSTTAAATAARRRRGYRQAMHRASLNESAAAGILQLAGWHQMCRQEGAGACPLRCCMAQPRLRLRLSQPWLPACPPLG